MTNLHSLQKQMAINLHISKLNRFLLTVETVNHNKLWEVKSLYWQQLKASARWALSDFYCLHIRRSHLKPCWNFFSLGRKVHSYKIVFYERLHYSITVHPCFSAKITLFLWCDQTEHTTPGSDILCRGTLSLQSEQRLDLKETCSLVSMCSCLWRQYWTLKHTCVLLYTHGISAALKNCVHGHDYWPQGKSRKDKPSLCLNTCERLILTV